MDLQKHNPLEKLKGAIFGLRCLGEVAIIAVGKSIDSAFPEDDSIDASIPSTLPMMRAAWRVERPVGFEEELL